MFFPLNEISIARFSSALRNRQQLYCASQRRAPSQKAALASFSPSREEAPLTGQIACDRRSARRIIDFEQKVNYSRARSS
jgi:hypothetical protein